MIKAAPMAPNTKLASEEIAAVFPPEKLESLPLLVLLQSARIFLNKESRLTSPTCGSKTSKTIVLTNKYTNSGNILLRHEQDLVHWKVIEIGPSKSKVGMFETVMFTPNVQKWSDLATQAEHANSSPKTHW